MKKVFTLIIGSALLFRVLLAEATQSQQPKIKSFVQLCNQKNSSPAATRKTIDALLKKANTKNCQIASSKFKIITELDLSNNQISDVGPLASLINLKVLNLSNNQISDIEPLVGLSELSKLYLDENRINDIQPISKLKNLNTLTLKQNDIGSIPLFICSKEINLLY
jgi:internalin A